MPESKDENEILLVYTRDACGIAMPQIIYDVEMYRYKADTGKLVVVQETSICEGEAALGLDELVKLYPCVSHNEE